MNGAKKEKKEKKGNGKEKEKKRKTQDIPAEPAQTPKPRVFGSESAKMYSMM